MTWKLPRPPMQKQQRIETNGDSFVLDLQQTSNRLTDSQRVMLPLAGTAEALFIGLHSTLCLKA